MFGDTVFANVIMLGAAWQNGLVPVSLEALMRAIELNDVAIDDNKRAFACGRLAVADAGFRDVAAGTAAGRGDARSDHRATRRVPHLLSRRPLCRSAISPWSTRCGPTKASDCPDRKQLTQAVARALFKLMAYKDEYEVARLHTETGLKEKLQPRVRGRLRDQISSGAAFAAAGRDARGRPLKRAFGSWIEPAFRALARLKFLRGTPFDPFGYTRERRMERNLIGWYESLLTDLRPLLHAETVATMVEIASLPMEIRGYGPVKDAAVEKVMTKIEVFGRLPQP